MFKDERSEGSYWGGGWGLVGQGTIVSPHLQNSDMRWAIGTGVLVVHAKEVVGGEGVVVGGWRGDTDSGVTAGPR